MGGSYRYLEDCGKFHAFNAFAKLGTRSPFVHLVPSLRGSTVRPLRVAYNRRSVVERVAKVFGVPLSHGRIVSARLNGAIALDICRDFTFCSAECEAIYIRRSRKTLGGRL